MTDVTANIGGAAINSAHPLPVEQQAGEAHIGAIGGHTFRSAATLTRPADTNNYSANDAITNSTSAPTAIDFANCARVSGGGVTLMQARLTVEKESLTQRFRLWLYRDTPASIPNDNAAFSQNKANGLLRIGFVDFLTPYSGSDCTDYYGTLVYTGPVPVVPVATSLKGILQILDAYNTPVSALVFNLTLMGYQD